MPDQPDDVLKSIKNKLILLDRAMVSTDDNYPTSYHLPLEDLAEFIAEQVQEARIAELHLSEQGTDTEVSGLTKEEYYSRRYKELKENNNATKHN